MDDLGFADDRPIQTDDQDLLRRSAFAKNLAVAIAGWKNKESLVVALTGPWGSGKSSIKNLALRQFATDPGHAVIEFNPWEWSGQEKLSASFFDEVSLAIQRKDKSADGKRLAKVLRQYGKKLNAGAALVEGVTNYLPLLLGSALFASYLSAWVVNPAAQTFLVWASGGTALAAGAVFIKRVAQFLSEHAEGLDNAAKEAELTLHQIRSEIRTLLAKREHPLLIVMDDIDRLSSEQMKALFQLVKGNMDFPNVVFLLLFQRDIVEQGLERAGFKGAEYLEKIIQVPFSVPVLSSDRLQSVLFERLNAILSGEAQLAAQFDAGYWGSMYRGGLNQFFRSLRDVYRYTSTLTFHCRLLRGVDVAEINAVDLFALECLRTFAPDSYDAIPQHKAILTSSEPTRHQDPGEKEQLMALIQGILMLAPQHCRGAAEQIIQQLFPTLDWVFSNTSYDGSVRARWLRDSRVCCVETFDRYFELALPEGGVSNSLLHSLTQLMTDSDQFCDILRNKDQKQQQAILGRLETHIDELPLDQSAAVVETLLNAGEVVIGGEPSIVSQSAPKQAFRLLRLFLQRHDQPAIRSQLILRAFANAKGFVVMENLLTFETVRRSKAKPTDFDDAGFEQLKLSFVTELLAYADQNPEAFLAHWNFVAFAYRLDSFADGAGTQWVKRQVTTPERFVLFAQALVSKSTQYSGGIVSDVYSVRITNLDELLGIAACQSLLDRIQRTTLTPSAQQAIALVEQALERHQRGDVSEYD